MTSLIQSLGVYGVFLLMIPESACIPVPSEVTLLFSGFAVSQHWMSFPLAVGAATAGNLVGSLIVYGVGASRLLAGSSLARRSASLLSERPLRSVFLARLLPLARSFVSLPACARRVPLIPFVALSALGCAIWAIAFVLAGDLAGAAWRAVDASVGRALLACGAAAPRAWQYRC